MSEQAPPLLDESQVRHVAKLARLDLSKADVALLAGQISSILNYVQQIQEPSVEGLEPMAHPLALENVLRDDVVKPSLPLEAVLANAPSKDGPFFTVPQVLDASMGGG